MNPGDELSNFTTSSVVQHHSPRSGSEAIAVIGFLGIMLLTAWKFPQATSSRAFLFTGLFLGAHIGLSPLMEWILPQFYLASAMTGSLTTAAAVVCLTMILTGAQSGNIVTPHTPGNQT